MIDAHLYVQRCATLASLLEVSAYPKPGNVHRTRDHPNTRYEHFLAGGVAMGESMRSLAIQGLRAEQGSIKWNEITLGSYIHRAVTDSTNWQKGGNVNLGIILLFAPLSAAAGASLSGDAIKMDKLRDKTRQVIKNSTSEDAVSVYRAIRSTMSPATLGRSEKLDVLDERSIEEIRREGYNLYDVFALGSEQDIICREYVTGYSVCFDAGYSYLKMALENDDLNTAIVNTFLYILSENPDTLIQRKTNPDKAQLVSNKASEIMINGGVNTQIGMKLIKELDEELQSAEGSLNPGSTADLTATSIFLTLLNGWRP